MYVECRRIIVLVLLFLQATQCCHQYVFSYNAAMQGLYHASLRCLCIAQLPSCASDTAAHLPILSLASVQGVYHASWEASSAVSCINTASDLVICSTHAALSFYSSQGVHRASWEVSSTVYCTKILLLVVSSAQYVPHCLSKHCRASTMPAGKPHLLSGALDTAASLVISLSISHLCHTFLVTHCRVCTVPAGKPTHRAPTPVAQQHACGCPYRTGPSCQRFSSTRRSCSG
jgi:hypothetical protein